MGIDKPSSGNEEKRNLVLDRLSDEISKLQNKKLAGKPLRDLQKEALLGFHKWIQSEENGVLQGHIVMPNGTGKTGVAILLDELVGGRSVFLAWNRGLAEEVANKYTAHQDSLAPANRRTLGKIYEGNDERNADCTLTTFHSIHKWENMDWSQIRLLVVDEADVNGLSEKRKAFLDKLAREHGVIIVGMSATEEQGSGKRIQDAFPHPILHYPIPGTLQEMYNRKLVPALRFRDLYLDLTFQANKAMLTQALRSGSDIPASTVGEFIYSSTWNKLLLEDYTSNYRDADGGFLPSVVIYRNNIPVDNMVTLANQQGINAIAYTGQTPDGERNRILNAFHKGRYDMIVGSQLPGRGTDLPTAGVGYNCTMTLSPQLFWQAARVTRKDPRNPGKTGHMVAVLAKWYVDRDSDDELPQEMRPLSHATFFQADSFRGETSGRASALVKGDLTPPSRLHHFDLQDLEVVRSTAEVARIQKEARRSNFMGRNFMLTGAVEAIDDLSLNRLNQLQRSSNTKLIQLRKHLLPNDPKIEDCAQRENWVTLTKQEELDLVMTIKKAKNSSDPAVKEEARQASDILLLYCDPLIKALSKKFAPSPNEIEDFQQDARIRLYQMIDTYNASSSRFIHYALTGLFYEMMRWSKFKALGEGYQSINYAPLSVPPSIAQTIYKVNKLRRLDLVEEMIQSLAVTLEIDPDDLRERIKRGQEFTFDELALIANPNAKNQGFDSILAIIDGFEEVNESTIITEETPSDAYDKQELRIKILETLSSYSILEQVIVMALNGIKGPVNKTIFEVGLNEYEIYRNNPDAWPDEAQKLLAKIRSEGQDTIYDSYTLDTLGEIFGVSRERIRQIEAKTMWKLRSLVYRNVLSEYI